MYIVPNFVHDFGYLLVSVLLAHFDEMQLSRDVYDRSDSRRHPNTSPLVRSEPSPSSPESLCTSTVIIRISVHHTTTVVTRISLFRHRRHPNVSSLSHHLVTFSPCFKSSPGRIRTSSPSECLFRTIQVSTRTHPSSSGCYICSVLSRCHQVSPSSNLPTVLFGGNQTQWS